MKNLVPLQNLQSYADEFARNLFYQHQDFAPYRALLEELYQTASRLNFPIVTPSIGLFLQQVATSYERPVIFEMGSGFGGSAFWYWLVAAREMKRGPSKVYLTERRQDLQAVYEGLPWPVPWREGMNYFCGDAFDALQALPSESLDMVLVDGEKASYLDFIQSCCEKMKPGASLIIDNAYFGGGFLDPSLRTHKRAHGSVAELHQWLGRQRVFSVGVLGQGDGIVWLKKMQR